MYPQKLPDKMLTVVADELREIRERLEEAHSLATEGKDLAKKNNEAIARVESALSTLMSFVDAMEAWVKVGRSLNKLFTSKAIRGFAFFIVIFWMAAKHDASEVWKWLTGWAK